MKDNSSIRASALESLKGNWGIAIGGYLVYYIIIGVSSNLEFISGNSAEVTYSFSFSNLLGLVIGGPMTLGIAYFSLAFVRNQDLKVELIFDGFKIFLKALSTYLLMMVYILLWSLLFIIPGIIKALAYSQTFYILADDNTIGAEEAIQKSKQMMDGYKTQLFVLLLYFFVLIILGALTLGIAYLWLFPYMNVSFAHFYQELKNKENPTITTEV